ncbi:hypothetical protein F0562_023641 [Nyssa sinensis]|uniref:Uncharacterized protein n=1 Tax=Nyssa sinensis TaxID=561372 RepID=A0A5J5BIL2_9ASTE|nr:hypothetical protein F0562_023641 [Nyssa sinensis]
MDSSSSSSFSQYQHLSMINVGNFVSIKLTKANYLIWEAQMRNLIVSQNLVRFIDGQIVAPPQNNIDPLHVRSEITAEIENPEDLAWRRTDWLLKGWIMGSLSEEVLGLVVRSDSNSYTARDVWDRLAKEFDQKPKPEIQLQKVKRTKTATARDAWAKVRRRFLQHSAEKKTKTEQKSEIEQLSYLIRRGTRWSDFLEIFVDSMSEQELTHQDEMTGFTVLHVAASVGNVQVAKLLVKKAPLLPNIEDSKGWLPLHIAAGYCHREMTSYLMKVAADGKEKKPFEGESGVTLMRAVMTAKFYGVSVEDLPNHPTAGDMEKEVQIIKGNIMSGKMFSIQIVEEQVVVEGVAYSKCLCKCNTLLYGNSRAMGAGLDGLEDESADRVNSGEEYDKLADMISSSKEEVAKNNWISNDVEANSNAESFVDESLDLLIIENISMGNMKEQVEINPIVGIQIQHKYLKLPLEMILGLL